MWVGNAKLNNTRYIYPSFNKYATQGENIQWNHSQIRQSRSSCEGYNLSLGSEYLPPSVDQLVECCLGLAFSLGRVSYMQSLQENGAHCKQWIDIHYETLCQLSSVSSECDGHLDRTKWKPRNIKDFGHMINYGNFWAPAAWKLRCQWNGPW